MGVSQPAAATATTASLIEQSSIKCFVKEMLGKEVREILGFKSFNNNRQDCNTYVVALLKVETWIHGRILECVWWQVNNHTRSRSYLSNEF